MNITGVPCHSCSGDATHTASLCDQTGAVTCSCSRLAPGSCEAGGRHIWWQALRKMHMHVDRAHWATRPGASKQHSPRSCVCSLEHWRVHSAIGCSQLSLLATDQDVNHVKAGSPQHCSPCEAALDLADVTNNETCTRNHRCRCVSLQMPTGPASHCHDVVAAVMAATWSFLSSARAGPCCRMWPCLPLWTSSPAAS